MGGRSAARSPPAAGGGEIDRGEGAIQVRVSGANDQSDGRWAGRSAAGSLPAGVAAEAGGLRVRVRVWGSGWGSFHGRRL